MTPSIETSPAAATSAKNTRTPEGEAQRDDENYCHVSVWEYPGDPDSDPVLHKEALEFEYVKLTQRSYK